MGVLSAVINITKSFQKCYCGDELFYLTVLPGKRWVLHTRIKLKNN